MKPAKLPDTSPKEQYEQDEKELEDLVQKSGELYEQIRKLQAEKYKLDEEISARVQLLRLSR